MNKLPKLELSSTLVKDRLKLWWSELVRLEYTEELMIMYLQNWVLHGKVYGRDFDAFSDLIFDDIFLNKPARMYEHSWFTKELEKARQTNDEKYWNELKSMKKFFIKGSPSYTFHDIPTPPRMISEERYLEEKRTEQAKAQNELILQSSNPVSGEEHNLLLEKLMIIEQDRDELKQALEKERKAREEDKLRHNELFAKFTTEIELLKNSDKEAA